MQRLQDIKSKAELLMKQYLRILSFLLILTPSYSQKIPFSNFTVQNGLPQSSVNAIVQDLEGYIWFATQVGVARYDGYKFEYFSVNEGLVDVFVNCMLVDHAGRVWFGTEGGISVFDGSGFSSYTLDDGLVSKRIDRLVEDLDGNIWVGTAYGLSVITPDTIVSYIKGEALTDNSVDKVFVDSKGRVHVATSTTPGLSIFENPFSYQKFEEENSIWDIVEDARGNIWYATQGSGIRINLGKEAR
jgi:ligand-binding sensor domain-containing protein